MPKLREQVDFVVGVDTHKLTHTASVVDSNGAELATATVSADASGYLRLLAFGRRHAPARRIWAIEGTGSYGGGLMTALFEHGEGVVEIDRPVRPARRNGAKSDALDAARAAREVLSREHLAQPRCRGEREALRVLLRTRQGAVDARRCARLRTATRLSTEPRTTLIALRSTARRALALEAEAHGLEAQIEGLVRTMAPQLLDEPGIGALTAAQILCAWSHPGRLRSEAAFAALAGVAPIPASSGRVVRHRLNRSGDRQLNRALHTIVLCRLAHHEETRRYAARRAQEGKTDREIRRCLKRHLARRLFKLLERGT